MAPRTRYLGILLSALALLPTSVGGADRPPAAWAPAAEPAPPAPPPAALPSVLPQGKQVIAASQPVPPPFVPARLPIPDDGLLLPLLQPPSPELVARATETKPTGVMPVTHRVQSVSPGRTETGVVQVGATSPAALANLERGAGLAVDVIGPAESLAGVPLRYEIVVRNLGTQPLTQVRLDDHLPPGAKLRAADPVPVVHGDALSWPLGDLEARGERRLRVEILSGGTDEVILSPTATFRATSSLRTALKPLPFHVTQSAPEVVQRGTTFAVLVRVANNGETALTGVVLQAMLPPGLQHPQGNKLTADLGTLAPGTTKTVRLDVQALQSGSLETEVVALAAGGLKATARRVVLSTDAALAVKLDVPALGTVDRDLLVALEASNPNTAPATNVRLSQRIPEGFDVLEASTGGVYDQQTRSVRWILATLEPGQRQNLNLRVRPRLAGEWTWQTQLTGERVGEARAEQSTSVVGTVALTLQAMSFEQSTEAGGAGTVEVHVVNQGSAPGTKLQLRIQTSENLRVTRAEGPTTSQQGQQVAVFDVLPTLGARQAVVYKLRVQNRPNSGPARLTVELAADNLSQPLRQELAFPETAAPHVARP